MWSYTICVQVQLRMVFWLLRTRRDIERRLVLFFPFFGRRVDLLLLLVFDHDLLQADINWASPHLLNARIALFRTQIIFALMTLIPGASTCRDIRISFNDIVLMTV
jgi:hypothetical protein